ncbi:18101_t:CDS:10 [Funneliformis geosporum]|uniref:18101_t:CDS:1 n=1 Tax=Funneliformis geosporum TaxID=1117311 RepID=A0A9W4SK72_9GLOM|nr:18101_t:CDS:10 [Funneliformis geosporum]
MSKLIPSNVASNQTMSEPKSPLVKSVKDYFVNKDHRFYIAVSATVILAGVGLYYFWSPKPPRPKSQRQTQRSRRARSTRPAGNADTGKERGSRNKEDLEVEEFESYTQEQISALPIEKRVTVSQILKSRGNEEFGQSNYSRAMKLYTQAIAFNQDPVFYSNRAACYYNTNEYASAIEDCNNALRMDPLYVKALNRRAMAYEQTSRYEESLHDFTAACIIGEFRNENSTKSIDRLLRKVASIKAQEIIQNRAKRLPSSKFISSYLEAFRKVTIEPYTVDTADNEKEGDNFYRMAETYLNEKQYEAAMEAYGKAIDAGCSNMAEALNMRGTFTYLMGDSNGALEDFKKALEIRSDYVQAYVKCATIYMEQGNTDIAWQEFEEAIKINPNDPDIYYHRGQVYFLNSMFDKAVNEYQRRIELDPDFVYAYIQLAISQYKDGSVTEGIKTCRLGLQKFAQSAEMHNYYGELLADQRNVDEAMEQFDKAIELQNENFALPFVNKAMLCFHIKNDPAQAEEFCRKALEIEPESDIANTIMSEILLARGNLETALQYLEKYQEVARTEAELQGILEYAEAARSHIAFKRRYPQHADRLASLTGKK